MDFGLKLRMDSKKQAFLDMLRKWGWIYVRAFQVENREALLESG
jgi:hypothetical protein